MTISISVAMSKNRLIGIKNRLPWSLPADLAYFRKNTLNKTVIMGRKTYESIGKALSQRENIVLTRYLDYQAPVCKIASSLEEAIQIATSKEVFIIGGSSLYRLALPLADKLYLTLVDVELEGDVFFPEFSFEDWEEIDRQSFKADEHNIYDYVFLTLKRRKSSKRKASRE